MPCGDGCRIMAIQSWLTDAKSRTFEVGRVPLFLAATLAVAVTLLLYAGFRWGWPFIITGITWFVLSRRFAQVRRTVPRER